jgi:hypothetical protein
MAYTLGKNMSVDIVYTRVSQDDDLERIGSNFCKEHGDNEHGIIPDSEYDRLYDHLGEVASKYASYSDDGEDADFMGSRYVDQIPWITLVAADEADPAIALKIALGGFSSEILGSKKVVPQVLTDSGFTWDYPHVTSALSALIEE